MIKYHKIKVAFPNHSFESQCSLTSKSFDNGLITKFHNVGEEEDNVIKLLAKFYRFGADYFETGKLSGEDVAKKLENQLGEIWLDQFHFVGCWPHSVNFGELCFSSDPTVDIEITWKFKSYSIT